VAENNAQRFRQQINRPADFGLWLKSAGLLLDTSGGNDIKQIYLSKIIKAPLVRQLMQSA
jgi:hypothetical protein